MVIVPVVVGGSLRKRRRSVVVASNSTNATAIIAISSSSSHSWLFMSQRKTYIAEFPFMSGHRLRERGLYRLENRIVCGA